MLYPLHTLITLVLGLFSPPPGRARIALGWAYGLVCHVIFASAVLAMVCAMFFGMSRSLGSVPQPWSWLANLGLLLQFPLVHSLLLSRHGRAVLSRLAPAPHAGTLSTTTYAIIASLQLLALFALWTPSGVIWWQAEGAAFWAICTFYAAAWGLLGKASIDAGAEVQSGALGWMSLVANKAPKFPDMPESGLFALIRQPIYLSFALTTWFVPVWTPDQLLMATVLTSYCLAAPVLKERRFKARYGARFERYRAEVPYMVPGTRGAREQISK